jgi:hypothetical protein
MTEPIFRPLTGIVQVGPKGKPHDFDRVGVYPPDRNGLMEIVITGDGKAVYITLQHGQAEALADRLNAVLGRQEGQS